MFAEINKDAARFLPFVLCTVAQCQPQGDILRPQGFEYHQFIWVAKGSGEFTLNGETRVLEENQGVFFAKNVPHSYRAHSGEFETTWLTFLGCEQLLEYYHIDQSFGFSASQAIRTLTGDLDILCQGNSNFLNRSSAGYNWLISVLELIFAPTVPIEQKITQYMENHYNEMLSLEDIADYAEMNKYTLCRYYRSKCNVRLMDQLKKIRISKAKHYLRYSSFSVEHIGKICGFESPSYFGKRFKEENGMSPREYRKKHSV